MPNMRNGQFEWVRSTGLTNRGMPRVRARKQPLGELLIRPSRRNLASAGGLISSHKPSRRAINVVKIACLHRQQTLGEPHSDQANHAFQPPGGWQRPLRSSAIGLSRALRPQSRHQRCRQRSLITQPKRSESLRPRPCIRTATEAILNQRLQPSPSIFNFTGRIANSLYVLRPSHLDTVGYWQVADGEGK